MATYEELRARLEEERAHLRERLELLREDSESAEETREGSPFGKREEEATEAFELEKRLALERQLRESLAEVEHALQKFATNTYGNCENCGRPIEADRLAARPQATLCMQCKSRQVKRAAGAA
ncbi:MAG TPA: molecular chaperone DnaK [Dehalococcoidia bacterium]|nr:molecular chaperone DnaK [Dehalococcoidia bacterium]